MDFRKVFDSIPEEFDKWRAHYCAELFADVIEYSKLNSGKATLEIGPGTGQATEPILKTGCSYLAIELGENLAEYTKNKFSSYYNFKIVNADFETYDFGQHQFDLVYSAGTIQWIPEKIGFPKVYDLLKSGGTFAMLVMRVNVQPGGGYTDEPLYSKIQEVYAECFHPETAYTCSLDYDARGRYGFTDLECRCYYKTREFNADDYVAYIGTHADHITLQEPYKTKFFEGIRGAVLNADNKITLYDKIVLYLARKP